MYFVINNIPNSKVASKFVIFLILYFFLEDFYIDLKCLGHASGNTVTVLSVLLILNYRDQKI